VTNVSKAPSEVDDRLQRIDQRREFHFVHVEVFALQPHLRGRLNRHVVQLADDRLRQACSVEVRKIDAAEIEALVGDGFRQDLDVVESL
jgi:hypothetical protein